MGWIGVEGMDFFARHGVHPEEHVLGGRFTVDVYLDLDFAEAIATDDINKTANYETVYGVVSRLVGEPHKLLESLSDKIARELLEHFTYVQEVKVRVTKHQPPIEGLCERTFVEYALSR